MAGKSKPKPEYKQEGIGRPSMFTPERRKAIVEDIANRIPYEYAAEANGICEDTLYDWLALAKEHKKQGLTTEYTSFLEAIKNAEKQRIGEHCNAIAKRPKNWQADAWILERRWYKHFGANAQLNELNHKLTKLLGEDHEK